MQSIHKQVLNKIRDLERGSIFFPEDFVFMGNRGNSVCQAGAFAYLQGRRHYSSVKRRLSVSGD